ncbi:transcription factor [Massilia sp. KIM]|uniref:cupin-like domain-containing protein n=1 Tax=Massilia sp. KIM TaxID=1955422 RepID=UPI00098F2B3B|nr:cupin-like domain-containing protein [Massilia sp. KIM]OON62737.1 transcription factor [Massilia sp. KIM]
MRKAQVADQGPWDKRKDEGRLPPRLAMPASEAEREALDSGRARRVEQARGIASIPALREAIRQASERLPAADTIPSLGRLDSAAFRLRAAEGLPFLIEGVVNRWPIAALDRSVLRGRFGALPVRARVGDYVGTAFAPDRAMRDMSMANYLDLVAQDSSPLPPYVGNLGLRELNALCHWPNYFAKPGPARFWIGPERTVTPLHCDYDDNLFAQVWGSKRIFLAPPHHDRYLYAREANPLLFASPFDPEAPDYAAYPLARHATLAECIVGPGDLLYVPAGWYHQVRALSFSLSSNRWSRALPMALGGRMP